MTQPARFWLVVRGFTVNGYLQIQIGHLPRPQTEPGTLLCVPLDYPAFVGTIYVIHGPAGRLCLALGWRNFSAWVAGKVARWFSGTLTFLASIWRKLRPG